MIGELWKRDIEFEDINLLPYFQKFVLQTAIFIGYGIELDCYKEHSQFCQEIIDIENKIIRLRSPISNLQDSIPCCGLCLGGSTTRKLPECVVKEEIAI